MALFWLHRNSHLRKYFRILVVIVSTGIFICLIQVSKKGIRIPIENVNSEELSGDEVGCHIPTFDPFDKSIEEYIIKMPPLNCATKIPYWKLTYVDYNGILYINQTTVKDKKICNEQLTQCYWQSVDLIKDYTLEYGTKHQLLFVQNILKTPIIYVGCQENDTDPWYENLHIIVNITTEDIRLGEDFNVNNVSVFMLVIDSMSKANFIRQMPQTYEYLAHDVEATIFNGLVKVEDNTFPNILPILSGLRVSYDEKYNEVPYPRLELEKRYVDDLPLLWFKFRDAGYETMYAEDMPRFGLFTYATWGFQKQPVNHYMRPYFVASESLRAHENSEYYCFMDSSKHSLILKYAREFIYKAQHIPSFGFAFISEITHGDINRAQLIDSEVYSFVKSIRENNEIPNTILVVMGDHGHRFDPIRKTTIGRLEERMPFFSISLPHNFSMRYPHLKETLNANKDSLTSWFDFHEILVDVLRKDFDAPTSDRKSSSRHGISVWRDLVPVNRSCTDAGIINTFCVCNKDVELLEPYESEVEEAAVVVIGAINNILQPVNDLCHNLTLKKIANAAHVMPADGIISSKSKLIALRIVVEVSPSDAVFEAVVEQKQSSSPWIINGNILRINEYGNQSSCIATGSVKLYCFCIL